MKSKLSVWIGFKGCYGDMAKGKVIIFSRFPYITLFRVFGSKGRDILLFIVKVVHLCFKERQRARRKHNI